MSIGPGKYGAEAEVILLSEEAEVVLVIVLGGKKGGGFSMTARSTRFDRLVPNILRKVATNIERGDN